MSGRTNGVQGCFRGLSWDQSTGPPSMWLAEGNGAYKAWPERHYASNGLPKGSGRRPARAPFFVGLLCGLPKGTGPIRPGPSATHVEPRHWPNRPGPSRPGRSVKRRAEEGVTQTTPEPPSFTQHGPAEGKGPTEATPERPYAHQPCQQPSQKNGESTGGWEGG